MRTTWNSSELSFKRKKISIRLNIISFSIISAIFFCFSIKIKHLFKKSKTEVSTGRYEKYRYYFALRTIFLSLIYVEKLFSFVFFFGRFSKCFKFYASNLFMFHWSIILTIFYGQINIIKQEIFDSIRFSFISILKYDW